MSKNHKFMKKLPNILTMFRFVAAVVFLYVFLRAGNNLIFAGLSMLLFAIASFTDMFDGIIARNYDAQTEFGKLLDPIADKCMTLCAVFGCSSLGLVPFWMFWIMLGREVFVTLARIGLFISRSKVIPADFMGKQKTCVQIFAISMCLIFLFVKLLLMNMGIYMEVSEKYYMAFLYISMLGATVLTVTSGIPVVLSIFENKKDYAKK